MYNIPKLSGVTKIKGNISNIPIFLAATLAVAFTAIISSFLLTSFEDATTDSQADQDLLNQAQSAVGIFDIGIVFINLTFYLGGILLATQIRTHPVFALPAILFLGIGTWLSSELANVYALFGSQDPLTDVASQFGLIEVFMSNLPVFTLGLGGLLIIVMFSGRAGGGETTV